MSLLEYSKLPVLLAQEIAYTVLMFFSEPNGAVIAPWS